MYYPRPTMFVLAIMAALTATTANANTTEPMLASWYGKNFDPRFNQNANPMANGEWFRYDDPTTVAHKELPLCTQIKVRGPNDNVLTLVVRDRGPYTFDKEYNMVRELDVSSAAAKKLGFQNDGKTFLEILDIIKPAAEHRYGQPCDSYLG